MKCICGNEMNFVLKDIEVSGITIHNVPHYVCNECHEESFKLSDKIDELVHLAQKEGMNEIDFK